MLNERVLRKCCTAIETDLGDRSDPPPELANTIANAYYRFHEDHESTRRPPAHASKACAQSFIGDTAKSSRSCARRGISSSI